MSEPLDGSVAIVLVSAPADAAEDLATAIVEAGVAACVNILPSVKSIYRWQERICRDTEALLLVKTAAARVEALRQFVLSRHPYELPEVIAIPVATGHGPYLEWVLNNSLTAAP